WPVRAPDSWRRAVFQRLPGPMLPALLEVENLAATGPGRSDGLIRPGGAELDPGRQVGNLRIGQLALGRHAQDIGAITNRFDEKALLRLAGHNHPTTVSSLKELLAAIELQVALFLVASMALVAVLN